MKIVTLILAVSEGPLEPMVRGHSGPVLATFGNSAAITYTTESNLDISLKTLLRQAGEDALSVLLNQIP